MTRITVTLTDGEREALRLLAFKERRDSRAQAALIIRADLERRGLLPTEPGAAPDALTSPTSGAALGSRKGKEERTIDKPTTGYLEWLRQNIVDHFDEGELRDLCFGMGIDYDDLPGQSKKDKARELVARCKRTSRIRDLVAKLTDLRPKVSWEARPE